MLKKCLGRQFLFVFLVFFIFSCSFFESSDKNASLSFRVDESLVEKITSELSRAAVGQNESEKSDGTGIFGENLWLEISVKGDWERAKNLPFAGGTTLLFENVPVGSEIYAEAFIYQPENSDGAVKGSGEAHETASESASGRKVLYKGVSEKIRIEQGENSLPLVIKKAGSKDDGGTDKPESVKSKIRYELNGGQWAEGFEAPLEYEEGKSLALPDAEKVLREKYGFAGWHTSSDGGTTLSEEAVLEISSEMTGNITLYAVWIEGAVNYKVHHYQQNLEDDEYSEVEEDLQTLAGIIGEKTKALAKKIRRFYCEGN